MPVNSHSKIAFVGTGIMGSAIAGHILDAGYDVTVTNRTKAKAEGLTPEETAERDALRQEYLNAVMRNAREVLDNTYIVDEKGNKRRLKGKGEQG